MGKAKKAKKQRAKNKPPTPLIVDEQNAFHIIIKNELDNAKKDYSDVRAQYEFFGTINQICRLNPGTFHIASYQSEVPITIFVGLGKQQKNVCGIMEYKQRACSTLCALMSTVCLDAVFKYGGAKLITEMMMMEGECNWIENFSIQEFIFEALRNLSGEHWNTPNDDPYNILGKEGFHNAIIKAMKTHPKNETILPGGVDVLRRLVDCCRDKNRKDTMRNDTIGSLLMAVDNSQMDPLLASKFCEVLHSMGDNETITFVNEKANGLKRVLAMMERHHCEDPMIQGAGCWFLARFARDSEEAINCCHVVIAALKSCGRDDEDTRRGGMCCLSKVLAIRPIHQALVLLSGHVPVLLEFMGQHEEVEVQIAGCALLGSLTYRVEADEPVTVEDATHLLARALRIPLTGTTAKDKLLLWYACSIAIVNMLEKVDAEKMAHVFLDEDCFSEIVTALWGARNKWNFQDFMASKILLKMASLKSNEIKLEIAKSGGIGLIVDCMKQNSGDASIQIIGCQALGNITINKDPRIFEAISNVDGVNIILDAIERFPKEKTIFNFGGSAAILTREYEDNKKYGKLEL